ncbi:hypothetical protein BIV60_25740 [Bacillus sp. MUM 116]|uniref:hypothetical protein n=1 Tax=Bacillus sp. MUM 116 TaxID=1678002 RepID=UPI0008F58913|nr:hypothetical protein [Bacillus sp. MUM 116]OIK08614.1 hypothetical protein BIV60_25740 [Bacillus sp. MUM 116]
MLKILCITIFILFVICFIFVIWIKNREHVIHSFTIPTFLEDRPEHLVDEDRPPTIMETIQKLFNDKNSDGDMDDGSDDGE